jgi:hypothetical protein
MTPPSTTMATSPAAPPPPAAERARIRAGQDTPPSCWEALERHLTSVSKPAQYVGGEHNQVDTDWTAADTRWLLCYPDTYEVGQPNQGIQILYEILNERPPRWPSGLRPVGRPRGGDARARHPDRSRSSTTAPLWAFDVFAVTLPHELGHTNLLNLLDLGGVPIRERRPDRRGPDRARRRPRRLQPRAARAVHRRRGHGRRRGGHPRDRRRVRPGSAGRDRDRRCELLRRLAAVEGVYVPAFYEAALHRRRPPEGRPCGRAGRARRVPKRTVQDLEEWQYPRKQIVPLTETVHERFSVEIFRGCTRGCRFCQAGMITRPVRERKPETVQKMVEEGVKDTGFEEVGLLSLSSADHSGIGPIARDLADTYEGTATSLSLPSTRVDAFNVTLSNELSRNGRRTGLTFAPEAGSERMRKVINKMVSEEDLLRTAEIAFSEGWRHIKLYFMVGLPTETDEDVLAIADLGIKDLRDRPRTAGQQGHDLGRRVRAQAAHPVPVGAAGPPEEIRRKLSLIRHAIKDHGGLKLRTNDPEEGVIEGLLARGDRRVAPAVERAWQLGARFDGWHEMPTLDTWRQAMAETGVDLDWFSYRERDENEALPWDHLDSGLRKAWLWEDWQDARSEKELDDCRWSPCYDCGVCPGLSIEHDTGYTGGFQLPVLPSGLGGSGELPTAPSATSGG